jgi:DNA-binding XRE family transcriptional regulator
MQIEATLLSKIRVSDARAALGLSQRDLAELASVATQVVVNAEKGRLIRRMSAHALLQALNEQRASRNEAALHVDELDWKIQGEG